MTYNKGNSMHKTIRAALQLSALITALGSAAAQAGVADQTSIAVMAMDPPRQTAAEPFQGQPAIYNLLKPNEVTQKWNLCALFPHTTNDILRAYLYGTVEQAKHLGAQLTIYDAGGYANIDKQMAQFDNCLTLGAQAILMFSVSPNGMNQKIEQARAKGIKVVDLNTGVATTTDARVVVTYKEVGKLIGDALASKHPAGSGVTPVVLLPGPAGVSWSEDSVLGFKDAIAGSDIKLEKVVYGQSGRLDQQPLVENILVTYPGIKYIVGMGSTIEAALTTLRERGKLGDIGLYATFITADLLKPVRNGDVAGVVVENSVSINQIAVDMAVRSLQGSLQLRDAIPAVQMMDKGNVDTLSDAAFAPRSWKAQLKVD
ncbi:TMAO reductase system periplasmic protein TorT [Pseudomonas frederiksbergensis]|uniref:TMAO reductase system periplasmic protein TorT n=2 Tax=Pseudomonas frederiksbergensis TaxID=104087 RepID=A0AB33ECN2_9PSED|nr:TMAO reductase system periplasmic protein TorT [Pseudomonas frederiksbergensis]